MSDRTNEDFFPPPKSIIDHGQPPFSRPARLHLINQGDAEYSEAFCRGFSLAATRSRHQSIIGLKGLPLILLYAEVPREGYRISVRGDNISVEASTPASFQYAGTTLGQLLEKHPDSLPEHTIEDEPSFPVRGVMLDVSRCKVPTMKSLFEWVDMLACWKINHLQLYTEHTFAYSQHRKIWQNASPMTAAEIRELDDYCRMLNIELVPNQNSFGHLHRWLKHPDYIHLAEAPDGFTMPWGEKRSTPFSLNPLLPESIEFLAGLYDELLPNFRSRQFNIGGDETMDLGQGASRAACEERGKGEVYLEFLNRIRELVEQRDHTMLFWGDIVLNHPELIPRLSTNAVALLWGYEAEHPFDEQCAAFEQAGLPFWVCPGTSTWNSIAGRLDNALRNMDNAARAGTAHGAGGMLITEWGDNGHWQTRPFSMIALAAGAYAAWHGRAPEPDQLASLYVDVKPVIELGNLYRLAGFDLENRSPIFPLLRFRDPAEVLDQWSVQNLESCLERIEDLIRQVRDLVLLQRGKTMIHQEMLLGATMLRHALRRGRWLKKGKPPQEAPALAEDMRTLIDDFKRLWLARNREGGLEESMEPLIDRLSEYEKI